MRFRWNRHSGLRWLRGTADVKTKTCDAKYPTAPVTDRMKEQTKYADAGPSKTDPGDSEDNDTNEYEKYFSPDPAL